MSHHAYLYYLEKIFFSTWHLIYKFYKPKKLKMLYQNAAVIIMVGPTDTAQVWWDHYLFCKRVMIHRVAMDAGPWPHSSYSVGIRMVRVYVCL